MSKLDKSKAFDPVEWEFFTQIMLRLGFHSIFVNWILKCLNSYSFSFNINGSTIKYYFGRYPGAEKGKVLRPPIGDWLS